MYSDWVSVSATSYAEPKEWRSVVSVFPAQAGKEIVNAVVKTLASNLGISSPYIEPSNINEDKDVQWCMEVIGYGLGLPLSEHVAIRDCVNIYCEWMLALTKPKICVPQCVCDEPNIYVRKMLPHLYNLFLPRFPNSADIINRQALYCHRVLRTIETVAQESTTMDHETWNSLLLFLLHINDTLLSPPSVADDIGSHLCERILGVLIEVWLIACQRSFPTPSLWKTFRELACSWRHRATLIDQWNRVNLCLTSKIVHFMFNTPACVKISDEDSHLIPSDMSNECIVQVWFRMLHLIGNPVELCKPEVVSQTPKFYHYALSSEMVIDPCQHPCLSVLPQIFYKAMKGISILVDMYLGLSHIDEDEIGHIPRTSSQVSSSTPPHNRKSFLKGLSKDTAVKGIQRTSIISGLTSKSSQSSHHIQSQPQLLTQQTPQHSPASTPTTSVPPLQMTFSPTRPMCNSILHLFGAWLFQAALIGSEMSMSYAEHPNTNNRRPSSLVYENKQTSGPVLESFDIPPNLSLENFEAGQAEALGSLCRIFAAKRSGESILPVYLARFYSALQYGLSGGVNSRGQLMSNILLNSCDLLCKDLDGIMVLVPQFLQALEMVLPTDIKMRSNTVLAQPELRYSAIHLLLSMLPLPLHFLSLPIKAMSSSPSDKVITFQSLNVRLVNLLINSLQVETESTNTHMLLGGLLFCIQDSAACEEMHQVTQPTLQSSTSAETVSTLLSSDSTHALFLRATYLICHRLISSWKTDLNVSLAALEVLSGLARIHLPQKDSLEGKRAVKWICDYIVFQCSRPPPAHSKDLHSTIVAAYQCVTVYLVEHPDLLDDSETVNTVLEVVELGISGSKSQSKKSDPPKLKGDKELKPASMRVKDAAEAVLGCMLDHVGYFPPPCGPQSLSSLLDEKSLLQHCKNLSEDQLKNEEVVKHFRYFAIDNSVIMALLEQQLGNEQDPLPTVIALVRGPFGRYVWTMQLRHLPHHKLHGKYSNVNPGRPLPLKEVKTGFNVKHRYFPESVDKIPLCQADKSIPALENISRSKAKDLENLSKLLTNQINIDSTLKKELDSQRTEFPNPETECKAPRLCQEFQTSRLLLSHLGFLHQDSLKESLTQPLPSIVALDQNSENFFSKLADVDATPSRTADTVFILYVKRGQTTVADFLQNTLSSGLHLHFEEFLKSLGWPVDVKKHAGWTGHISTSWKYQTNENLKTIPEVDNLSVYDGKRKILYWSDVSSELAFVLPSAAQDKTAQDQTEQSKSSYPLPPCPIIRRNVQKQSATNPSFGLSGDGTVRSRASSAINPTFGQSGDGTVRSRASSAINPTFGQSGDRKLRNRSSSAFGPAGDTNLQNKDYKDNSTVTERKPTSSSISSDASIPRALSLNFDSSDISQSAGRSSGRKFGRQHSCAISCDMKVVVVWLENLDDHISFPLADIMPVLNTGLESSSFIARSHEKDLFVIYVHPLQNGLFKIKLHGPTGRMTVALPLIDGMVISRRTLGILVRQTASNMLRRKRLDADSCQPPHVRRKLKIQDIANKHHKKLSEPEFYIALFKSCSES